MISVTTTQLCHWNMEAEINTVEMNKRECIPVNRTDIEIGVVQFLCIIRLFFEPIKKSACHKGLIVISWPLIRHVFISGTR